MKTPTWLRMLNSRSSDPTPSIRGESRPGDDVVRSRISNLSRSDGPRENSFTRTFSLPRFSGR